MVYLYIQVNYYILTHICNTQLLGCRCSAVHLEPILNYFTLYKMQKKIVV